MNKDLLDNQTYFLLDKLRELQVLLNQEDNKLNLLEAYTQFVKESSKGRNCTYALKCQKIFMRELYPKVKTYICEIQDIIDRLENKV